MAERFSDRQGYRLALAQITVREDAHPSLRDAIPLIAKDVGMTPHAMREVTCAALLKQPDPENWSAYPNVWQEVCDHVQEAPWYRVYDIAESMHAKLAETNPMDSEPPDRFRLRLNEFFMEHGIGWELCNGQIIHRGSAVFAKSTREVPDILVKAGYSRAGNELNEALKDISRRPKPDITGAIQHTMAALEATAHEVTGQVNPTLGRLVPQLDLPRPLDQAVSKLWGYASERCRHIREQEDVDNSEAELTVSISGALCEFLIQRDS